MIFESLPERIQLMNIYKMNQMKGGWFIGNFEPSVLKTTQFEIGILKHKKGEQWPKHKHKYAEEYNYIIEGQMTIQNTLLSSGDIFILNRGEIADPVFLEDCVVIVVKVPSIPGDKIIIKEKK